MTQTKNKKIKYASKVEEQIADAIKSGKSFLKLSLKPRTACLEATYETELGTATNSEFSEPRL